MCSGTLPSTWHTTSSGRTAGAQLIDVALNIPHVSLIKVGMIY
jgi:hypothetical protein